MLNYLKGAILVFTALYITAGTIAMGIVHHQHKGNIMGWLAGTPQVMVQAPKVAQRDECEIAYNIPCEQYQRIMAESLHQAKIEVSMNDKNKGAR